MAGWSWTYPHKLGYDVAGVVQAVGSGCKRLKLGDEVWGEARWAMPWAMPWAMGHVPWAMLCMLEAGAMPMVALTGLESLTFAARGSQFQHPNTTVLVLGGRALDQSTGDHAFNLIKTGGSFVTLYRGCGLALAGLDEAAIAGLASVMAQLCFPECPLRHPKAHQVVVS
eukprot:Skav230158  [mRNA]  locus=scaffold1301:654535:660634:- [translate_table: standard]